VRLGANLARMEARVLFDELLCAFPDFQGLWFTSRDGNNTTERVVLSDLCR
jgi:cytochrome P450